MRKFQITTPSDSIRSASEHSSMQSFEGIEGVPPFCTILNDRDPLGSFESSAILKGMGNYELHDYKEIQVEDCDSMKQEH